MPKGVAIVFVILLILVFGLILFWGNPAEKPEPTTEVTPISEGSLATTSEPTNMTEQKKVSTAIFKTNLGEITLELYPDKAPKTVENFIKLAQSGFYNGTLFHRVIKDFMIQGGDPNTKSEPTNWAIHGTGGPGYKFEDEINDVKIVNGVLAMANSGPNTNGSQFFIVTADATPWLDGKHTAFGRVTAGMDIVEKIEAVATEKDHPIEDVILQEVVVK